MDNYATHLPVLRALAKCVPMRRVVEFGAGDHSTPFFLSLPDLERLVSVETDAEWAAKVKTDDPRHEVVMRSVLAQGFDFVFVDDGVSKEQRVNTIRTVLSQKHPVVAVHDAEIDSYARAIRDTARGRTLFVCVETPQTAVIWPRGKSRSRELLQAYKAEAV